MKSTNTKWFTLVELIIVITILAVLATIAFISFQGYSQEAKDSGKMSEMSEIVKAIAIKEAREWLSLTGIVVEGTASWTLKEEAVGINSKNTYAVAVKSASGTYLIAGKMNKYGIEQAGVYTLTGTTNYFVAWTELLTNETDIKNFFGAALDKAE